MNGYRDRGPAYGRPPEWIDLQQLPNATRRRLTAATLGTGDRDRPLLRARRPIEGLIVAWAVGGLTAATCLAALMWWGFGDPSEFRQGPLSAAGYVAILVIMLGCLGAALSMWIGKRAVPLGQGRFVFPSGLVTIRGTLLRILPIEDLGHVEVDGGRLTLHFGGLSFERFSVPFAEAQRLKGTLESLAAEAKQDKRAGLMPRASQQDLFRELRLIDLDADGSAQLADGASSETKNPLTPGRVGAFALLGALVFGAAAFAVRNRLSDDRAFAVVQSVGTSHAFSAYIRQGGRHVEAAREQLEQALFTEASASVEGLRRFLETAPESRFAPAAEAELERRLEAAHTQLMADLVDDAKLATVMNALLLWARHNPPATLHVRVRDDADWTLLGPDLAPMPQRMRHRARTLARALGAGFSAHVPEEVLSLQGPPRLPSADPAAELDIGCRVVAVGSVSGGPLELTCSGTLQVPTGETWELDSLAAPLTTFDSARTDSARTGSDELALERWVNAYLESLDSWERARWRSDPEALRLLELRAIEHLLDDPDALLLESDRTDESEKLPTSAMRDAGVRRSFRELLPKILASFFRADSPALRAAETELSRPGGLFPR